MLLQTYVTAKLAGDEILRRVRGDRGATAVEYALMLALIAAIIVGAVAFLGRSTNTGFTDYGTKFTEATS
jgi:pilus assembly protein Flp/PilA